MTFDPSISFGAILNAVALIIGFAVAFTRIGGRIDLLSQRLGSVEEVVKSTASIRGEIATIQANLGTAQREISELRQGFISSHRKSIDGEY